MKKFLKLDLSVDSFLMDGQPILNVSVSLGNAKDWLLCLHLLQDNLIEACVFSNDSAASKLEIRLGASCEWKVGSQSSHFIVSFTAFALDYLRSFFARYYRDGVAEVDHVDIEVDDPQMGYITVSVDEHLPPVSSDEVRRRLGIG
ncbi:hypothetical protein [Singulisphaera acidiphila]|uniref:Uncharacterized protein n=1 Tax=Singulisphaera acidiphila (strain ATCC BAA-1392 / DSM 18658 / VKM B-2454 / MOB10) TaxID=886293 RepID=L0D807_SINAD|nr:hypothetical protein [Singulisphaera acidiphila]AGA24786.1 hypothetical protein Sinac_0344 [Singulisphaera acidiphila DSM 18658]